MGSPVRLVVATLNAHKLRELGGLLAGHSLIPLPYWAELPEETGRTFEDNAVGKAHAAAAAAGIPAVADDSGIEVYALDGAPGVRSARFAGEDATDEQNLQKLLDEMRGKDNRDAAVRVRDRLRRAGRHASGVPRTLRGPPARAARAARAASDTTRCSCPADLNGDERTMAELSQAEKDEISHRGRAVRELIEWLPPGL